MEYTGALLWGTQGAESATIASEVVLMRGLSLWGAAIPVLLIALGIVFLLDNLDMIEVTPGRIWGVLWPLLIIFVGLSMLRSLFWFRRFRRHWHGPRRGWSGVGPGGWPPPGDRLVGQVNLGGPGWKLEDREIRLGAGEVRMDLTQAEIPDGETNLSIHGGVGAVRVRVPREVGIAVSARTDVGSIDLFGEHTGGLFREMSQETPGY
ncbi:MAG: LiaF domain-containing protein, partial [Dehalococcoidia bacterium]